MVLGHALITGSVCGIVPLGGIAAEPDRCELGGAGVGPLNCGFAMIAMSFCMLLRPVWARPGVGPLNGIGEATCFALTTVRKPRRSTLRVRKLRIT
jgi:hypothetical protein